MTNIQAAVLWPGEDRFSIEDVELEDPRDGEVLVRVVASGICHTDMVLRDGSVVTRPVILGHEGSGIVEKLGAGVAGFEPGDHVVISFATCGECPSCEREAPAYCHQFFPLNCVGRRADGSTSISEDGKNIGSHIFGQSSFSTHTVCSANSLVKVDDSVPLEMLGPFGCGFQAGAGTVLNSLKVRKESSVLVLGAGAVGLSAVMAAVYSAGATTVIAVDLNDARLVTAYAIGATHTLNGSVNDIEKEVKLICPAGVDYVIDTTAHLPLVERCVDLLAIQGILGLVASYPLQVKLSIEVSPFMIMGKKIQGVMGGGSDIKHFIPRLLNDFKDGRFPVDKLIRYYDFADINAAIEDSERGETIKAIVNMP